MAGTTAPGTLPEIRAHVEPTSATASPSLPAAAPAGPDAEERLAGLVVLLGDISESIAGVRALVLDLETLQPGHGRVIGDALAVACFLAEFGAKYGAGAPSCDDAAELMLSDRAMRAGVGA
jgi:hypothetical protein